MTPASFVTVAGGVALAAQRALQEDRDVARAALTVAVICATRDTARTVSGQARGVGGWRDGRYQLTILAAGVTAALQARGVSRPAEPLSEAPRCRGCFHPGPSCGDMAASWRASAHGRGLARAVPTTWPSLHRA
jgi:hypothetical protein